MHPQVNYLNELHLKGVQRDPAIATPRECGGGGVGPGAAAFQARLFVSLDTTVSIILFHTLFSDDL